MICILYDLPLGFLLFYIFRDHIKRTKSYTNAIWNYGVKLSKSDKKNEK